TAAEQHVADDGELGGTVEEDHVAGRVAWAVDHFQFNLAHRYPIAIDQPAVGLEHLAAQAPAAGVLVDAGYPEAVGLVRAFDPETQLLRQHSGLAAMIDMAVG